MGPVPSQPPRHQLARGLGRAALFPT